MNRRTYIWKVGDLAVVMVAVVILLFGCSRESIEDAMEGGGPLSAPEIAIAVSSLGSLPTSVIINVGTSSYEISLVNPQPDPQTGDIPPSDIWCYEVTELSGKVLSHWVLAVECLVTSENHIIDSIPPGTIGQDGSTGYGGVKWDLPETFTSGTFCIILDTTVIYVFQTMTSMGNWDCVSTMRRTLYPKKEYVFVLCLHRASGSDVNGIWYNENVVL